MEKKKRQAVPAELLSIEFLSQFRTEDDVSSFLTDLHAQVYILIKKYPTFQSKSIPLTNLNGTTSFITNDKYVYKTGDYN